MTAMSQGQYGGTGNNLLEGTCTTCEVTVLFEDGLRLHYM